MVTTPLSLLATVLPLWPMLWAELSAASDLLAMDHILDITGQSESGLSLPTDVTVAGNQVAVVDGGNHRVVVFDANGGVLFIIGGKGSEDGRFLGPVGIDSDMNGHIYVADTGNHRIQVFSQRGEFRTNFPVVSNKVPVRPVDVAVDLENGVLYVSGNTNHKIMAYELGGKPIREWGHNGAEHGEFRYPATIALLPDKRIGVVDVLNTRLQIFHPSGEFSLQVGEWGVLPGQLFRPKGVATDHMGRFYISDSYLNVIQVFTESGQFLYRLRSADPKHRVDTPTGVFIHQNRLYVSEMLDNKVSVFSLGS